VCNSSLHEGLNLVPSRLKPLSKDTLLLVRENFYFSLPDRLTQGKQYVVQPDDQEAEEGQEG
jgi:hypothetical protein